MKLHQDASPVDVGVPSKLFPEDAGELQGSYPYESAVQELRLLVTDCCPQRKLECIGESRCVFISPHSVERTLKTWLKYCCFMTFLLLLEFFLSLAGQIKKFNGLQMALRL